MLKASRKRQSNTQAVAYTLPAASAGLQTNASILYYKAVIKECNKFKYRSMTRGLCGLPCDYGHRPSTERTVGICVVENDDLPDMVE